MHEFHAARIKARRIVHETMSRPALCSMNFSLAPGDEGYEAPIPVTVRVHDKFVAQGDLAGTNFHYAERAEDAPRIIFLRGEIAPERGLYVSLETGLAYQVDHVDPADNITVTTRAVPLSAADCAGFPVPVQ